MSNRTLKQIKEEKTMVTRSIPVIALMASMVMLMPVHESSRLAARAQDAVQPVEAVNAGRTLLLADRQDEIQAPRGQEVQAPRGQEVQAPRGQEIQAPREEVQAPRGQEVQAPRGQEVQAPRGQEIQAPHAQDIQASPSPLIV